MIKPLKKHGKRCCLCGKLVFKIRSKYCLRCSHFAHRLELKCLGPKVVKEVLDHVHAKGYICENTGLPLDMVNS